MENRQSVFYLSASHALPACEPRALRARKTLTPRFTDFFTDFEKKTDCFCSLCLCLCPLPLIIALEEVVSLSFSIWILLVWHCFLQVFLSTQLALHVKVIILPLSCPTVSHYYYLLCDSIFVVTNNRYTAISLKELVLHSMASDNLCSQLNDFS